MHEIPNPNLLLMKVYAWNSQSQPFIVEVYAWNSQSQPFIDESVCIKFQIPSFYWWKCMHEIPNPNLLLMEVYPWNSQS